MKLVSFSINGKKSYGELKDGFVIEAPKELLKRYHDVSAAANINELKCLFEQESSDYQYDLKDIKYLPSLQRPNKIICVGVNYPE